MVNSQGKKQIVFVELAPSIPIFKIARSLKVSGKYETVLISFSKVDQNFINKGFDKTIIFEMKNIDSIKGIISFIQQIPKKGTKKFLNKIKKLNPYVVQFTGSHILTLISLTLSKKHPRIFFLYDIWQYYQRKFSFKKNSGRMQYINAFIEKKCFKKAEGILNKCGKGALDFLEPKTEIPTLDFLPYCLDEWIITPNLNKLSKKDKEIHVVYTGCIWINWGGHVSFLEIVKRIINQKIHLHLYPSGMKENEKRIFEGLAEKNKYFHLHEKEKPDKLNKKISKFDYALFADFCDESISPLWTKTGMAGKIFTYIEAGLPIITSKQFEFIGNIVQKKNISIPITYHQLTNLKNIIQKTKYPKTKDLKNIQEKLKISKNIKKLERFYEKVVEVKKHNKT